MKPQFFSNQTEFRKWLADNHTKETELLVGYYKISSGKPSITWPESVDQALCFGWIDGIRRTVDDESYCIRFTPRRANSTWSDINIKKVEELSQRGLMQEAGIAIYKQRKEQKSRTASYENEVKTLSEEYENLLKENSEVWELFNKNAPSHKRTILHWIMSAKQEVTRLKRLNNLIETYKTGKRL